MLRDELYLSYVWNDLSAMMKTKIAKALTDIHNEKNDDYKMFCYQTYMLMQMLAENRMEKATPKDKLKQAAEPLVRLLQSDYDSNTTALVENDHVTLRRDKISVSFTIKE